MNPSTDLALEATAALQGDAHTELPGVRTHEERHEAATVTWVDVVSPEGERAVGKAMGSYVTLDCPGLRRRNRNLQESVGKILVAELDKLLKLGPKSNVLIVGLGNWNATPDALGPRVTQKVLVTRHLHDYVPAEVLGGLRSVAALSPGVLGITGIETAEVIQGVVERIGTTIQLADTGISPGSGIGNQRKGLNRQTLGVPVIAIGVPTVVHAATIANDVLEALNTQYRGKKVFFQLFSSPEERQDMIRQVLGPSVAELVVTPKEIDDLIDDMAKVIAGSLNAVLHSSITSQDLLRYLN